MDKADSGLRDHLYRRAELLGAIRLPNTAFKKNANAEVTTDILFLRRLEEGEKPSGHDWRQLAEHINPDGTRFQINRYFAEHPHMMCGVMAEENTMYRAGEPALIRDGRDLGEALQQAVAELPQGIYRSLRINVSESDDGIQSIPAPDDVKQGAYTLHEGKIACRQGSELVLLDGLSAEASRRISGLIQLREAVREVLRTQLEGHGDDAIIAARRQLNLRYDQFVARSGPVNATANRRAFRSDPDFPLLCSLEDYRHDTKRATKTDIFRERTIHTSSPVRHVESAKDALIVSLNERGAVDLQHMADLLIRDIEGLLPELKGLVFFDPTSQRWETEDSYLFGDVRQKLAVAREAAAKDERFRENVEALEAVQPADLLPSEIEARLGAAWIPSEDVAAFASALLNNEQVEVSHAPQVGASA